MEQKDEKYLQISLTSILSPLYLAADPIQNQFSIERVEKEALFSVQEKTSLYNMPSGHRVSEVKQTELFSFHQSWFKFVKLYVLVS